MQDEYKRSKFLDIGNTSVILKSFNGTIFTDTRKFLTKYFKAEHLLAYLKDIKTLYISNVVTELQAPLEVFLASQNMRGVFLKKEDAKIVDFSQRKGGMGADMVAQIEAAAFLSPNVPFCVVSMGTAITIMVVDSSKVFQGGVIAADYKLQLESLFKGTSILPAISHHIKDEIKNQILFTNSQQAIQSGTYHLIYYGIQGILNEIKTQYSQIKVIGTGGFGVHFKDLFDHYDENLLFFGLQKVFFNKKDTM